MEYQLRALYKFNNLDNYGNKIKKLEKNTIKLLKDVLFDIGYTSFQYVEKYLQIVKHHKKKINSELVLLFFGRKKKYMRDSDLQDIAHILFRLYNSDKQIYDLVFDSFYTKWIKKRMKQFLQFTISKTINADPIVEVEYLKIYKTLGCDADLIKAFLQKCNTDRLNTLLSKLDLRINATIQELEMAYSKGYYNLISLLIKEHKIFPNNKCLKILVESPKYSCQQFYDRLNEIFSYGIKPDIDDIEKLVKYNSVIKLLLKHNILDPKEHNDIIVKNVKHLNLCSFSILVDAGFIPNTKCLEEACKWRNLIYIKYFVDTCNVGVTPTCLENSTYNNNHAIIKYLIEKDSSIISKKCVKNMLGIIKNKTAILVIETFLDEKGDDMEPLQPVYDSDSEE